jgi:type I restriction enzyme, S subunit
VKAGWEVKALGEVATIINGGTPKSEVASYWDGDIDWLTPKDMGKLVGHLVHVTPRRISREGLAKCSAHQVPAESVIMSTRAPIGHLAINAVPMAFNQGCRGMVPSDKLHTKYLFYVLCANVQALDDLGTGATFKELSAGSLKSFPIPLPPLAEQKQIVAVLDAAFEGLARARANTEANLQAAKELFETTLEQIFADGRQVWSPEAVVNLGSVQTGSTPKTNDKHNFGNFLPFVKPADFNLDGTLTYTGDGVSELGAKQSRLLKAGSILMVCIGATIGKVAFSTRNCVTNQQVNALTPRNGVDCKFVYYQMRSRNYQDQVIHSSGQATLPIINKSKWSALGVFIPQTLGEQRTVVERLDRMLAQCGGLQSHYRAKLADLDALRQSLLQKAFAGELT